MSDKILITRNQLARFLPNPETIKAFENLFKLSTQLTPDSLRLLAIQIEEASNDGNNAISGVNALRSEVYDNTKKVITVVTNHSVHIGNYLVICDATSGAIVVTMPLASSCKGKTVTISKKDTTSNTVSIIPSGTNTIIGEASQSLLLDGECLELVSDGINWEIGG